MGSAAAVAHAGAVTRAAASRRRQRPRRVWPRRVFLSPAASWHHGAAVEVDAEAPRVRGARVSLTRNRRPPGAMRLGSTKSALLVDREFGACALSSDGGGFVCALLFRF